MKQTKTRFLFNHEVINAYDDDPKLALSCILSNIPNVQYWSPDALKEMVLGSLEMTQEYAREMIRELREDSAQDRKQRITALRRFCTWAGNIHFNLSKTGIIDEEDMPRQSTTSQNWDRIAFRPVHGITPDRLLQKVYDMALAGEKLSIIPGFHYTTKEIVRWK